MRLTAAGPLHLLRAQVALGRGWVGGGETEEEEERGRVETDVFEYRCALIRQEQEIHGKPFLERYP